ERCSRSRSVTQGGLARANRVCISPHCPALPPHLLASRTGRDVFDRCRRPVRALRAIRHTERRVGCLRTLHPVHGTAESLGTSCSSPGPGLGGDGCRANAWSGAYPRVVYPVVRTLKRSPSVPVRLRDEYRNRAEVGPERFGLLGCWRRMRRSSARTWTLERGRLASRQSSARARYLSRA